jgi:ISXO2-like transposase domain/Transposase zinc-ribbon domain
MNTKRTSKRPNLEQSAIIEAIPEACHSELAAVEFFEQQRWGNKPCCVHCGCIGNVYKMIDQKTGQRNKRFLWRCRDCKMQYTVRIGTVYEDSRIELRHWIFAFWRAATSKKGVAALEIQRQCQLSYKSALFMMHRIRFGMTPSKPTKLSGTVEIDETYVGGKSRPGGGEGRRLRWQKKTAVFGLVERDGNIHRRVVPNVSGRTLRAAIREMVDSNSRLMTDEYPCYANIGGEFKGGHERVRHTAGEYARGDANTNTIESSFAILKRGINGIHHAVSKKHLHRYVAHYDFLWNARKINDGERTAAAIQSCEGKRLMYRQPVNAAGEDRTRTNQSQV